MKVDMHVHSTISDGKDSIYEILKKAKKLGLDKIALTNHDTIEGLDEACLLGEEVGVKVIRGVEISAYDFRRGRKVHILGYNIGEGKNIDKLCRKIREDRHNNSMWQLNEIENMGYKIDKKKILDGRKVLYKQHILQELIDKGYTDKIYGDIYSKIFKNGGPLDKDIDYVCCLEAVKAIKKDGGIAILAHPGQLDSFRAIGELVSVGLDGIEVNHPSHSPWDKERIRIFKEQYGLILTGGSDYHGDFGESLLGSDVCIDEYVKFFD